MSNNDVSLYLFYIILKSKQTKYVFKVLILLKKFLCKIILISYIVSSAIYQINIMTKLKAFTLSLYFLVFKTLPMYDAHILHVMAFATCKL